MKLLALLPAILVASCAALWLDPIRAVGPETYEITHTMGKFSPVKGVRQGVIDRAMAKCRSEQKAYSKLREEMTPGGTLSYTLTFQCHASEFGI